MDMRTKIALVTLEGPLLHRVDMVRYEATVAHIAEMEIALMRHPSQRGRVDDL